MNQDLWPTPPPAPDHCPHCPSAPGCPSVQLLRLMSSTTLCGRGWSDHCPPSTDVETEDQRGKATCPKSHSRELGDPRVPDSSSRAALPAPHCPPHNNPQRKAQTEAPFSLGRECRGPTEKPPFAVSPVLVAKPLFLGLHHIPRYPPPTKPRGCHFPNVPTLLITFKEDFIQEANTEHLLLMIDGVLPPLDAKGAPAVTHH